jgi:hypothetical protein
MVQVHLSDESNCLLLTEGYLPDFETLQTAAPRNPAYFRFDNLNFKSREEALARILNTTARQRAYTQRYAFANADYIVKLPLETWVIGPSVFPSAPFAEWFFGEAADTNYRILIHRNPRFLDGREVPPLWHDMYCSLYQRKKLRLQHKEISHPLKQASKTFLQEILMAYSKGINKVESCIRQTGHTYFVTGLGNK